MRTPEEFDEIRPYDPEELPAIFEELIADPEFRAAAEQVLPEVPYEEACNRLRRCRTNLEVQQTFFYPLLHGIVDRCSDGLVLENSQSVDKRVPHTFITNHRDIVMDSAFLSISLLDNGFGNTMEIAIGDNLLIRPWIKKTGKGGQGIHRTTLCKPASNAGFQRTAKPLHALRHRHET